MMVVGKLVGVFTLHIFVGLLCLLPLVESAGRSLSLQFNNCDPDRGTCVQCWNADAVNGNHPKEASNLVETSCSASDMTFEISKGADNVYDWGENPKGWAVHDRTDFKIAVKASVGWLDLSNKFSRVAFEVQLCNIDYFMLCKPIIAPNSFFDDVTIIDDVQNLQTTRIPSVTRFVDLDMVDSDTLEEVLNFGEIRTPGTYRILTSLVVSDGVTAAGVSMISDLKYLNVVHEDPMELSDSSFMSIVVISSITSTVILFLLVQTVINRKAQVFELTQGKFIIAMQVCALMATSSLILWTPRDPFCKLQTPLLYLSTHMVYAILLGRMWRVRAVISPLLLLTLERKDDWTTKIVDSISRFTACARRQNQQKKIRMQITDYQLARVIMLLILPQLLVQLLILTLYRDNKSVLEHTARNGTVESIYVCEYGAFYSTLHIISVSLIGVEFFLLALLMYGSRDLPSLFNEAKYVWQILRATFVFVLSGTLLIAATIDHYNTANVRVLVPAFVLGLNMCQTCWVITWSKLKVAWGGQTILVTKLIADHNFSKGKVTDDEFNGSTKYFTGYQPSLKPITIQNTATVTDKTEGEPSASSEILKESVQGEQIDTDDRSTDSSVFLAETEESVGLHETEKSATAGFPHGVPLAFPQPSDDFAALDNSTISMATTDTVPRKSPIAHFMNRRGRRGSADSRGSTATRGSGVNRGSMVVRRRVVGTGGPTSSVVAAKPDAVQASKGRFSVFGGGQSPVPTAVVVETIDTNPRLSHEKIRISEKEAPGRRLLLRMIDVQRMLTRVNTSLLTGIRLDRDDWEELREGCVLLGEVFQTDVVFDWDNEEASSIGSASHQTPPGRTRNRQKALSPPRRPLGYKPGLQKPSSLPPKSRITSTTNAGPARRSVVTFKPPDNQKEEDLGMGSMLRKPLEPIMSIGNPIVGEGSEAFEDSERAERSTSGDDLMPDPNRKIESMPGDEPTSPTTPNGTLPKHRVRARSSGISPAENPIVDELPLGQFPKPAPDLLAVSQLSQSHSTQFSSAEADKPPRDPLEVSELSQSHSTQFSSAEADKITDMTPGQYPVGKLQKGTELPRFSGISQVSSGGGSDAGNGSHHDDSMSTLGVDDDLDGDRGVGDEDVDSTKLELC